MARGRPIRGSYGTQFDDQTLLPGLGGCCGDMGPFHSAPRSPWNQRGLEVPVCPMLMPAQELHPLASPEDGIWGAANGPWPPGVAPKGELEQRVAGATRLPGMAGASGQANWGVACRVWDWSWPGLTALHWRRVGKEPAGPGSRPDWSQDGKGALKAKVT